MKIVRRIMSGIGTLLVLLLIVAAILWVYYGGLTTIMFSNPVQGGEILIYKEVVGDYSNTGVITEEVYEELKNMGIETFSGFGIFYDNPDDVERNKCRSDVGCILEPKDKDKLPEIEKHFKVKVFPVAQYTSTNFPYKGMLSMLVGMWKVYPAIKIIQKEQNPLYKEGPIMEIYNMQDSVISYRLCGDCKL